MDTVLEERPRRAVVDCESTLGSGAGAVNVVVDSEPSSRSVRSCSANAVDAAVVGDEARCANSCRDGGETSTVGHRGRRRLAAARKQG
jgi:hypothetical protein